MGQFRPVEAAAAPRVLTALFSRLPVAALAGVFLAVAAPPALEAAAEPAPAVDFQRDVRPILSDNCFACHGPDEATREADLRLDTRDGAFSARPPAGRSNRPRGPAVVAGDVDASLLVERINHADPLRRMPPEVSQKSLSDEQIGTLTRWIEHGARFVDALLHGVQGEPQAALQAVGAEPLQQGAMALRARFQRGAEVGAQRCDPAL